MDYRQNRFGLQGCCIFVALMIASLTSHRAYVEMVGILLTFACCMSISEAREIFFSKPFVIFLTGASTVVTACFLWFLLSPQIGIAPPLQKSANNNFMFLLLVVIFVTSFCSLIIARLDVVITALSALLTLNGLILMMQTVLLIVSKQYVDFVAPVTGEKSRYLNFATVNPIFSYRPTGLYVEPSTYSAAVGAMAVGYVLLCRARGIRPSRTPVLLAITSMLITQSAAAVVQAIILLVAVVLLQSRTVRIGWAVVLAVLLTASPGVIAAYFDSFLMKVGADSGIRFALVNYVLESRHGWDYIFGYGPFGLENALFSLADDGTITPQVSSLNDAGLLNFFIVKFGVSGLLIPMGIFLRIRKDFAGILFFAMLMSVKLSYMNPILYFGLLPLVLRLDEPSKVAERDDRLVDVGPGRAVFH